MISFGEPQELTRRAADLATLVEIGELLGSADELDEILKIILVAVTAGQGLRFNRAFLLLVDERGEKLNGALAVGPDGPDDAARIWKELDSRRLTLREMLSALHTGEAHTGERLRELVAGWQISLEEKDHPLVRALTLAAARTIARSDPPAASSQALADLLGVTTLAVAPLTTRSGPVGVLVADNGITGRPIEPADLDSLRLFAGFAASAIEKARLYARLREEKEALETVHRELRRNQQMIINLQRLSDLGEMSARVAHEIRNPLVAIGGFGRRALSLTAHDDPRRGHLEVIAREVTRLETILSEVLDFVRPFKLNPVPTDLNCLIRETLEMIAPERESQGVEIVTDLDASLPSVRVDAGLMKIALVNLLRNALQALQRLRDTAGDDPGRVVVRSRRGDGVAQITIEDNGCGVPEEAADQIFEPFFTTKASGSGLGLPIVVQVLREHGGRVRHEAPPQRGAAFHLDLPLVRGAA